MSGHSACRGLAWEAQEPTLGRACIAGAGGSRTERETGMKRLTRVELRRRVTPPREASAARLELSGEPCQDRARRRLLQRSLDASDAQHGVQGRQAFPPRDFSL
jgi:hypothetical protein